MWDSITTVGCVSAICAATVLIFSSVASYSMKDADVKAANYAACVNAGKLVWGSNCVEMIPAPTKY